MRRTRTASCSYSGPSHPAICTIGLSRRLSDCSCADEESRHVLARGRRSNQLTRSERSCRSADGESLPRSHRAFTWTTATVLTWTMSRQCRRQSGAEQRRPTSTLETRSRTCISSERLTSGFLGCSQSGALETYYRGGNTPHAIMRNRSLRNSTSPIGQLQSRCPCAEASSRSTEQLTNRSIHAADPYRRQTEP